MSNLLTTGSVSNINHCIQNGVVAGLDKVLGCNNNEVLKCALDGFTKMLECSNSSNTLDALAQEIEETGALDKIESLQQSENEVSVGIISICFKIIFLRKSTVRQIKSSRTTFSMTATSSNKQRPMPRVTTSSMRARTTRAQHRSFNFN